MFWILAAGMTAIVAFAIAAPLRRDRAAVQPAAAYDLRVYRDQLAEVDRDLERGVIGAEDADRLRAEIGRKVLDADRRLARGVTAGQGGRPLWAVAVLGVLLLGAGLLYWREGVPNAPDMPLAERLAAAEAVYRDRPAQAEAEAAAMPRPGPDLGQLDPDYLAMIDQLRAAVERNPDDPRGLDLLATNEMRLGNISAARAAQQRLVDVLGDQADAAQLMQLATLMIEAAGGLITPEAEAVLARSLARDPDQPQARYLQGVLLIQNGRPDRAFPIWRRLLEQGPDDAPWIPSIRAAIDELAWLAGQPDYRAPASAAAAAPGPDAQDLEAARDLPPEARQQMIEGMVASLQDRLASQGGTPEEWARLIGALSVLGDRDQARAILSEARLRFGGRPEALAPIDAAAADAGLDP
ncbi:c-type cytochrome biogenesis protein CcmI [Paracoccus aestuarii]|uniref:C-type cytochrome biogenesis protein CcmI n=1 Tax=Paracoccus aestuarii TaxID=453842 RepID=A0A418ZY38_9RHOB|nr:c-type cytochrome biogenesis protein CcmI [Paracoccus aestuarii]RJL05416.1 c-type cytochrome biogenesis protein CcmI [Paracoccus aestuarii]WCQ99739.1 c-type cytochrome biogenesis protein CcmI [Paracoccus aestuarii]